MTDKLLNIEYGNIGQTVEVPERCTRLQASSHAEDISEATLSYSGMPKT
jgi:hypothetical protein